jgi:hypothetical protein
MTTKKVVKPIKESVEVTPIKEYIPLFPVTEQEISVKYDLNWVALRREIQKYNFKPLKINIPKFNLWLWYCAIWNKYVNKEVKANG